MSTIELVLWFGLIASKLCLCVCLLKRGALGRLPCFSAYVLGSTLKSLLLLGLAFWAAYSSYYDTFFWASHAVSLLAFLTLIEFSRQVLPSLELPRRTQALSWLGAALVSVFLLSILAPIRFIENRLEVGAYLAVALVFTVIAIYARSLGLRWSRLLGGVSLTLGLLYLLDGVAKAVMPHFSYPSPVYMAIRGLSEIASLLAVISWIIVVLRPWGEYDLSEDEVHKLEWAMGRIEENFRRLFS